MTKYIYDGPVMEFDRCIMSHWKGETMAPSERKAKSNLAFQFKKQYNRTPNAAVHLPGNLKQVN